MAENNNEQQQIKIELKPEVAQGEYSNLAMINHASSEFVIDFAHMLPIAPPQIFSRVIMAPEPAKRLLMALQENIVRPHQVASGSSGRRPYYCSLWYGQGIRRSLSQHNFPPLRYQAEWGKCVLYRW